ALDTPEVRPAGVEVRARQLYAAFDPGAVRIAVHVTWPDVPGLEHLARDVVVPQLQVVVGVPQHVRDVGTGDGEIARLVVGREGAVADEVAHVFCDGDGQPARVRVQLGLRDDPAAAPHVERHHAHHVAQVGAQAAAVAAGAPD